MKKNLEKILTSYVSIQLSSVGFIMYCILGLILTQTFNLTWIFALAMSLLFIYLFCRIYKKNKLLFFLYTIMLTTFEIYGIEKYLYYIFKINFEILNILGYFIGTIIIVLILILSLLLSNKIYNGFK